jgi:phenylalanyl-tRNA synthetase alpha chain
MNPSSHDSKNQSVDNIKSHIIEKLRNSSSTNISTVDISKELNLEHQEVIGECKSLEMAEVIQLEKQESKFIQITQDGKDVLEKGSPELVLLDYLKSCGGSSSKKELTEKFGKDHRGFPRAMQAKYIEYDNKSDKVGIKSTVDVEKVLSNDEFKETLNKFLNNSTADIYDQNLIKNYQKVLKYITVETLKFFHVSKGKNIEFGLQKQEADLTKELLVEEKWEKSRFKKYNYAAQGLSVRNGALHPLLRVRTQFREILLELGFQEMPTNNFVESSFWNFDSLFQPQQHPARDAHDTFFLNNPKYSKIKQILPEYFQRVKEVHEIGGYESLGWNYNWSEEEASKNILRTHTTAVSSRMLYKLAEEFQKTGEFTPKKYFSIDRVFRNESLDATHLAEFHQIEGLVADYNLGLGHLIATIQDFFHRFGIKKMRFKPAYNPYTEPSMEIFAYHDGFKKWVEIGNSGIFRPEMLLPMGLPKNVSVIAWGLSLERPTMIHYGLKNIRDLFGHEVKIQDTKDATIYCININ